MRLLLLTHTFNSLTQRMWLELVERGHEVSIEFDINDATTRQAVALWRPAAIVAPLLKRAIATDVWRTLPCLIVHPGPPGDRGPSALDWAIMLGRERWGVTVLQAVDELDAGPVWAWREFPMRHATKSSLYRLEVTEAAVAAVLEALERLAGGCGPLLEANHGDERARPPLRQTDRAIDWQRDPVADVLRRIRAADGQPGVRDRLLGHPVHLHDAWPAAHLHGPAGQVLGRSGEAVARACADGAIWLGHLGIKDAETGRRIKVPATTALTHLGVALPDEIDGAGAPNHVEQFTAGPVRIIRFPFYNGAMSVARCHALRSAIETAAGAPEPVLLLAGGTEFWSNGLDLASIELADSPAESSWENIHAIDDVCQALIELTGKWVISALGGNAGAGGVFMALAADEALVREGVVLNPHYRNMGNLYGSEYWTYLLPRRLGNQGSERLMAGRMPLAARQAVSLGLCDRLLRGDPAHFEQQAIGHGAGRAMAGDLAQRLADKARRRAEDEAVRPLADYRARELEHMQQNFFGFDTSYHVARFDFITRTPHSRTPLHLARHRRQNGARRSA